ncbi:HNH endonuclease domain-containing protein [Oscillatoria sp. FACHB-1406]|uniref:HNH endonuclease domain-containing protein n=1 Tax=Oscillatoria sp. FACHB-1406 TaxID=2692846 RepID=UPI001688D9E2|nr:HNH endonuclease domain-containing protein [Oscillatoria sp. FACHB-1406]MBD2576514.1 hypothetical protein [Oscillatoria sp. FACHB-1406]
MLEAQLPESEQIDVSALARIFTNTTTSYKYLFFLSVLDILKRRNFTVSCPINFREIIVEMLANAWYPHTYFKLYFGTQDKIAQKLDSLQLEITERVLKFTDTDKTELRATIAQQNLKDAIAHLKRYVPFRLIAPFLETELEAENVKRGTGNCLEKAMPALADRYFERRKPFYKFDTSSYRDCTSILIHPDWANYIKNNYAIVRGWVFWEWVQYMQKLNPNTPNIINKIFIPQQRGSLEVQKQYWKLILKSNPILCIYSGRNLEANNISLDHYLPWSFVAHDLLWNLIPTHPSINSAKSNNLPSEQYFDAFVKVQHQGLVTSHEQLKPQQWGKMIESYLAEFRMSGTEDLLNLEKLRNAYKLTIQPLISLATLQGFTPNWFYRSTED